MQFLNPEWFYAFWLVVLVGLFFVWLWYRKRAFLNAFGKWETLSRLTASHSQTKEMIKKIAMIGALIFLIAALARPQWGDEKKEIRRKGIEIIFLLDTSLSMLAEDIKPSRFEKAKLEMKSFVKQLKGDRIGIVTFAGSGFIQSPLTLDYDAFFLFANSIKVGFIPDAGTSLSEAIRTAVKGFPEAKQKHHVVILLSDGEDLMGDVDSAIKTAREANVKIYTVGIGTKDGAPIPLRGERGAVSGYKKDRGGEVVITKLNEDILRQIAQETGGKYAPATPSEREVEWVYQDMQNIEKKEFKQKVVVEREDHFQIFIAFALILLTLETLLSETKKEKVYA